MHSAVRNVMRLFDRIKDFEKRVLARQPALGRRRPRGAGRRAAHARRSCSAPFAPHMAEELWLAFGGEEQRRTDALAGRIVPGARMSTQTAQTPAAGLGPADALVRDRAGLPPLRHPLPARGGRVRVPGLRQGTRRRLRLRAAPRATSGRSRREQRPRNIWHFEELLPIVDAAAQARVGQHSGYTPLIRADRLGAELGLSNLYLKDDSTSGRASPTRIASCRCRSRGCSSGAAREIGCVSTGNVGTAVASLAAKAGVDAYVFYPNRLEDTKARACAALGAKVCQVEGNYDEANRRCRELAEATGIDFANITLRPFYAEGAKTAAFEIVEQLEWRAPDHIVTAAAGGTLSSRLHKGLVELQLLGLSETDGDAHPHRAAERLQPDRQRDPRRGGGGPPGHAGDGGALAGDRRARRRLPGDRRGAQTRRHGRLRLRPRDLRRHRPAGGDARGS